MTENKPLKILLIDDDSFLLDMYLLKFKTVGIEVETAQNGQIALEKLRSGSVFDIMLVDIIIPGIDGIEFVQTVRAEKLVPNATIIMVTNQSDSDGIARTKALGVDGYIIKATQIPSEVVESVFKIYKDKNKQS